MCGIFGIVAAPESGIDRYLLRDALHSLFVLSETRGKESAGITVKNGADRPLALLKMPLRASQMIRTDEYQSLFRQYVEPSFVGGHLRSPLAVVAHSRLVTNGTQEDNANNQPVWHGNSVMVHNGIVTNVRDLWERYRHLGRHSDVDTEILVALVDDYMKNGSSPPAALANAFAQIEGAASVAALYLDLDEISLATNTGSLYYAQANGALVFGSEKFIVSTLVEKCALDRKLGMGHVTWLEPGTGIEIDMAKPAANVFSLLKERGVGQRKTEPRQPTRLVDLSPQLPAVPQRILSTGQRAAEARLLKYEIETVRQLRRCSRCVLPETFPFITFDINGVCNYCTNYRILNAGGREAELARVVSPYRADSGPECIVAFSGGRDSSFALHYIVHTLKLKPITFTYDWGMVTDLARRNIARVCGKLGIENILVSADIKKKRDNIRRNVAAWLKKPDLGMIPLFMAGDKQFFKYANNLKRETGVRLDIWAANKLENTDFKVGFCGIAPNFNKERIDSLSLARKVKLFGYYAQRVLVNPAYLNRSIPDTLSAYYSYYAAPRVDYVVLFDYIRWDEEVIERTLAEEYAWERSPDTTSTWRIGDGTAAFYNYCYFTAAGFSENDTFRSNQIREGMLSREKALALVEEENRPRYESIRWYLDAIGLDFEATVRKINKIHLVKS